MNTAATEKAFLGWLASPGKNTLLDLLRTQQDRVYNMCFQVLRHHQDAEDASQDCLLKMLDGVRGFPDAMQFERWVTRVSVNAGLDALRRRRARDEAAARKAEAMSREGGGVDVEGLYEALATLDDEARNLVVEHDLQKTTLGDLGMRLGITPAAVLKRVRGAREELRRAMGATGMAAMLPGLDVFLDALRPVAAPSNLIGQAVVSKAASIGGAGAAKLAATTSGVVAMASAKAGMVPVAAVVFAAAIGLGTGLVATTITRKRDQKRIEELEARVSGAPSLLADASGRESTPEEVKLARLTEDYEQLKREVATSRAKALIPSTEVPPGDADAAALAIRGKIAALVLAKDSEGLVKLLHAASALGEPGYPAAMEIVAALWDPENDWYTDLEGRWECLEGAKNEFLLWALLHSENSPAEFRENAVEALSQKDLEFQDVCLKALMLEKDDLVRKELSFQIYVRGRGLDPEHLAEGIVHNSDNPGVVCALFTALAESNSERAGELIAQLRGSADPAVREAAEFAAVLHSPPAAGVYIAQIIEKNNDSGIERGDIVTSWDGHDTLDANTLTTLMKITAPEKSVTVKLNRKGQTITLQSTGGYRYFWTKEAALPGTGK